MTIRDVPVKLHATLKRRAQMNRRSLNQEVIAELEDRQHRLGGSAEIDEVERKRLRAEQLIAKVSEMREGMSGFSFLSAGEIDSAIEGGRA